jgi:hypothetical protein
MGDNWEAADEDRVRRWLADLYQQLQLAHAGIVVASAALRLQNGERDVEVAQVLEYFVASRVDCQIQRAAQMIEWLEPKGVQHSHPSQRAGSDVSVSARYDETEPPAPMGGVSESEMLPYVRRRGLSLAA